MTLRGPVDANIPPLNTPLGYVNIDGKQYPIYAETMHRKFWESLFLRSGAFDDEVFDNDAQNSDLNSRIEQTVDRLEALEAERESSSDLRSELAELRQRLDAIESLPSVAEPVDAERLTSEILAATRNVVEDAEFNRPGIGVLGTEDAVTRDLVAAGFALLETGSSDPTPTRLRLYLNQNTKILWFDDGTSVRRLTVEEKTGTLGTNLNITNTNYVVVAGASYTDAAAVNVAALIDVVTAFASGGAASADTATGQWAVFLSSGSVSAGSAIVGTGNSQKIAEGASAGLTFQTIGTVQVDANDVYDVVGKSAFVGEQLDGTVYVYLALRVTSGGGEAINIQAAGTTFTSILG